MQHQPYPENVPGDFYVEDGCCTLCEVPKIEAPTLFAWAPNAEKPSHCYVCRQPATKPELDQMIRVIQCAELQCIRYRGSDPEIQRRLIQIGEQAVCDDLPWHQRVLGEVKAFVARCRRTGRRCFSRD